MSFVLTPLRQCPGSARNRNFQIILILSLLASASLPAKEPDAVRARQAAEAERLFERSASETDSGDYEQAIRDARAAAGLFAGLADVRGQTSAVNQAGLAETYAGQYAEARASLGEALRLALASGVAEAIVEERVNLASVDFFTGRYAEAAQQYAEAGRVIELHRAEQWTARRKRILLANQATLDQRLGRYREALASYRLALTDTSDVRPEEHAQILVNVGVLHRRMGDPYKALESYDQAGAIFARDQHADGELGVLKNRGIVLALDLGRLDQARVTFADAFTRATTAGNAREALQAQLYGAETSLRLGQPAVALGDFRAAHAKALELETLEEQWKALYGLARCETLLGNESAATQHLRVAIAVIEQIRDSIRVPSLKSDFFNDKREAFDALIALRLRQGAQVEELFDLVERGHSRGWRERLGLQGKVDLRTVQQALPEDALLLDYWTSPAGAAVVSVTKTAARVDPVRVDSESIRAMVEALPRPGGFEWKSSSVKIGAQLLPAIPARKPHILIVTDGALASLPFELLSSEGRLLVERHDITYLPTAALLVRAASPLRRYALPWAIQFRGFADPLFSASPDEDPDASRRLVASAKEVRDISSELGGRAMLHIGEDNKRDHLQERSGAPLLHIATHAFVNPGAIEESRILFSAQLRGGPPEYLYLKEAYELPLTNVELAVLSACDTERGRVLTGEGIESFSRAFLAAGARSTVTTLWRVPDATTASFMRIFYHHLQSGASRAEALRRAKIRFVESGEPLNDPHYWAAYVLTGEGLRPVSTAVRWGTIIFAGVAALLIVSMALVLRSSRRVRSRARSGGSGVFPRST